MNAEPGHGASLWSFAAATYAAPGVEAASLRLQDEGGQCVALLFWGLWCARTGRPAEPETLAEATGLARRWEFGVGTPLRAARRALGASVAGVEEAARLALRSRVAAASLSGERVLLEALEGLTPTGATIGTDPLATLRTLVGLWGGAPAEGDLAWLAAAVQGHARDPNGSPPHRDDPASPQALPQPLPRGAEVLHIGGESGRGHPPMHGDDERGDGEPGSEPGDDNAGEPTVEGEAAIRRKLGELRQAHQDLDAAVAALEEGAQPDQLQIARLKKKKLILRDQIAKLDNRLTPDIIA